MDELEHLNPKRTSKRPTARGSMQRADAAALHARAAAQRHVDRPRADAQALHLASRARRGQ
jgi:hypothetical protein